MSPDDTSPPAARSLPFTTLWRTAFLLATYTMMPLWILFGIGRATGVGHLTIMGGDVGAAAAIPAGLAIGAVTSLLLGALLTIGALVRVAVRRLAGR